MESSVAYQAINDDELVVEERELNSFKMVNEFIIKTNAKTEPLKDIKAYLEAIRLRPYLNSYIEAKEKLWGKSKILFTKAEKEKIIEEFWNVYTNSKKFLYGEIGMEDMMNEA